MKPKNDPYQKVTDAVVRMLEAGTRPWMRPWSVPTAQGGGFPLRANGLPYQGINVLILWSESTIKNYNSTTWMTFKQAKSYGANVRKGERGTTVVYTTKFVPKKEKERASEDGDDPKSVSLLRAYTVFNVDQIDGLPERFHPDVPAPKNEIARIDGCEEFVKMTKAEIRYGGYRAFYAPSSDHIQMPNPRSFELAEGYYATLLHELTHWTMHETRLNRTFSHSRFGNESYAMEELVAELGAAFLCATLGITLAVREDHAAYLATWLKVLKDDKRAIFTAAGHAQRATNFLCELTGRKASPDVADEAEEIAEAA